MATITLDYRVDLPDNISPAALAARMSDASIPIGNEGELDLLNMSKIADFVLIGPTVIVRTIVLLTNAASDALFPNDADKIAATKNLYRQYLAQRIPAQVDADDPVVVP